MKKILYILLITVFSLLFTLCAQAAEVTVYLNGSPVDFGRAAPEIKNSRVMLPFRDIAEAMGAEVTWDKETKQMCLLKNGRTVVHTLNENYIYVNGEAKAYDTSSDEVNGRTRMPVVMLAESLGASVSWDSETKSVYVSTTDSAKVITTMFSSNVVIDGETVTASVITTDAAERIKLVDTLTGNVINESYSSADYGDGKKIFTISYTPSLTNASENTPISIYAGDSTGYNEDNGAYYTGSILSILDTNPKIRSVVTSENSVDKNDYVTMKIYTNTSTDRIRVESDFQSTRDQLTNFTEYGNERVFEYKVKMTQ
ncbi:MAG: copper amine oxidase N-terminal domain-containing protein, partial [Firmicutes bacterium]|nr:copper amine oxidase N-terminal domain-containing protein [Bacillota bacterium]